MRSIEHLLFKYILKIFIFCKFVFKMYYLLFTFTVGRGFITFCLYQMKFDKSNWQQQRRSALWLRLSIEYNAVATEHFEKVIETIFEKKSLRLGSKRMQFLLKVKKKIEFREG